MILGQLPPTDPSFDPVKIGFFLAFTMGWSATGAWVDKDTLKVKAAKLPWNAAIFGAGGLGVTLWMLIPAWWLGCLLFLLFFGGASGGYVFYRNARVSPAQRVLTPAHFNRLLRRRPETEESKHAKDRVRIKGADGKEPKWPSEADENRGYQALQDLLFDAIWRRATVVDMSMHPQTARIVYRIDGVNREREPIERPVADIALKRLKTIAGMDPEESRKPQRGRLTATVGPGSRQDKVVEIVVKTSGSTAGQRLTMQLLSEESRFRLNELGLNPDQLKALEPLVERLNGVILVSGPRESGLSSTLYAMLRAHDAFMRNIHTLEVSTMMDLENVTQHVFDSRGGDVSFSRQLQSILRMDPDIVMIAECPDRETAELVAAAGRQNKKIYLGLPAGDTLAALRRYMQLVGDHEMAAAGLLAVLSQRLVRVLCPNCRKAYTPDPNLLRKANLPTDENRPFYRPPNPDEIETDRRGNPIVCGVCQGSGYHGRTGLYEVLVIDETIRGLLSQGAPLQTVKAHARKHRMQYLQEAGLRKVYEGVTSINEVLRVTRDDQDNRRAVSSQT
jgi:type II secretory ATPase GspE/PulE/Tfp pilus assembly ATPase PilB-like protein